jgi:hypothetical protein
MQASSSLALLVTIPYFKMQKRSMYTAVPLPDSRLILKGMTVQLNGSDVQALRLS